MDRIKRHKSILVTGGLGYVGRELVRQLGEGTESELHVLDNVASGEHRLTAMNQARFTLHRRDVRDADAVAGVMAAAKPTLIFHLAAVHFIPACEAAPGDAVSINVAGTVNLLHAARAEVRFVFASTAAVYTPDEQAHVEEDKAIGPVDIYGFTKLHGEHFVRYAHAQQRVDSVIVRLFNVVGPGETNPHLVPAVIRQLAAGDTQLKLGNTFPRRDYIDVSDAARGFIALAGSGERGAAPLICNLGTGATHSVGDVVASIARASGQKVEVVQDPSRMRAVDRPVLQASIERLRAITGWSPSVPLDVAMQRAWEARHADRLG